MNRVSSTIQDLNPWPIFETVLTWFRLKPDYDTDNVDNLSKGWEFIVSEAETQLNKLHQSAIQKTQNELLILRRISSNVRWKPQITQSTIDLYSKLDSQTLNVLLESRLDSSERLSCLRKTLEPNHANWLKLISQFCHLSDVLKQVSSSSTLTPTLTPALTPALTPTQPQNVVNSLSLRWYEQPYLKGVCGEIRTLAHQTTLSAETSGLTYKICSDVLWSIYLCLTRELVSCLNRSLNEIESQVLFEQVCSCGQSLVENWIKASLIKGTLSTRYGKLPKQWQDDEIAKLEILKTRDIAARFADGPLKFTSEINFLEKSKKLETHLEALLRKKGISPKTSQPTQVQSSSQSFKSRISGLEKVLIFRKPK